MSRKTPLKPSWRETLLSWIYTLVCVLLWILLIWASIEVIAYYFTTIKTRGYLSPESLKYATYIVMGCFVVLFVHRDRTKDIFGVKKVEK